jgi:hypothetical protein
MNDQQYGQSPYDQSGGYSQGGYGQGTGEQGQAAAYSQGQGHGQQGQQGQGQHDQHADEDVEIDWQATHEESIHISMDDLRSAGYEPPADDDSATSPSYIA